MQGNDGANTSAARLGRGVVTVVPVTSSTERVDPFQELLDAAGTRLARDSKAQAEQVRSIAVERVGGVIGVVPCDLMARLCECTWRSASISRTIGSGA